MHGAWHYVSLSLEACIQASIFKRQRSACIAKQKSHQERIPSLPLENKMLSSIDHQNFWEQKCFICIFIEVMKGKTELTICKSTHFTFNSLARMRENSAFGAGQVWSWQQVKTQALKAGTALASVSPNMPSLRPSLARPFSNT